MSESMEAAERVAQRVRGLELQNRRLILGVALLAATVILAFMLAIREVRSSFTTRALQAEQVTIVDKDGRARMAMAARSDGSVALSLMEVDGKAQAYLGVTTDGRAGLVLRDMNGKERAVMDLLSNGMPRLSLEDRDEKPRLSLFVRDDGVPTVLLLDKAGEPYATLDMLPESPSLRFMDRNGNVIWRAP